MSPSSRIDYYRRRDAFWKKALSVTWRFCASLSLIVIIVFFLVYFLNLVSERSGTIVEIVEKPKSDLFVNKMIDNEPVMQLPLGKSISYSLDWYYLEGGCTTEVTLNFDQKEEPRTHVSITLPGRSFPIGYPGKDNVNREQPAGLSPGLWHYKSVLTGICANGRKPPPETMASFYLQILDRNEPVFKVTSTTRFDTPIIHPGESLKWTYSLQRSLESPADIVFTLTSQDDKSKPKIYTFVRPAVLQKGQYENLNVTFETPKDISFGNWTLKVNAVTNLPGGRIQTDPLVEEPFEVIP